MERPRRSPQPLGPRSREARIAVDYSLTDEVIDWAVPVLYAVDPSLRLCEPRAEAVQVLPSIHDVRLTPLPASGQRYSTYPRRHGGRRYERAALPALRARPSGRAFDEAQQAIAALLDVYRHFF